MTFASPTTPSKKKATKATPNKEIVVKINTSKGYVTLGRIGLYDESPLHAQVSKLTQDQLVKLLANASLEIVEYTRASSDDIQLVL